MPAAANVVRRLVFLAPVVGLLALAAWVPSAAATGGIAAEPDPSSTTTTPAPAPAPAQQGTDVKLPGPGAVQQALHIAVTHRWDHRTRQAVRAFQRAHGLVVDGIVGP